MTPPASTAATSQVQKQILAAIQRLSEQLTAHGLTSGLALDLRIDAQDKLHDLENAGRINPVLARLQAIEENTRGIKDQLATLNGTVRRHDNELGVMKVFCDEQVKPALVKVVDLRIEIAKWAAAGGGLGTVLIILAGIAKAAGWI